MPDLSRFRWNLFELEPRLTPANTPPVLLADINAVPMPSSPANFCTVNGLLYFAANNAGTGVELYRTDGTSSGTVLVRDIRPGSVGANPGHLANINGTLYFAANDGTSGTELWKSDGTSTGTVLVKDIRPGTIGSFPTLLTGVGTGAVFSANDGTTGFEPWFSDGTAAGTTRIHDINPNAASSNPTNLTNVNGLIAFTANDGASGIELWRTDGVTAALQVDHQPGNNGGNITSLINVSGTLFFQGSRAGFSNVTLWKTALGGPEPASTQPVTTTAQGILFPTAMTNLNGTLYFKAYEATVGYELFKSDGTSSGTALVQDIRPGLANGDIADLANVNGTLLFAANDGVHGLELWKSDGTGTSLVRDANPGTANGHWGTGFAIGNSYYFNGNDGISGVELWKSDGTSTGTVLVNDIYPGPLGSSPQNATNLNGTLLFRGADAVTGSQLWKSDGSSAGTTLVRAINTQTRSSNAGQFTPFGSQTIFRANNGLIGAEPWITDGTVAGTMLLKDTTPNSTYGILPGNSTPYLVELNGSLYFSTAQGNVASLWKSDGTAAGTTLLKALPPNPAISNAFAGKLTRAGGLLYFEASSNDVTGLWRTDGTVAGTIKLHETPGYRFTNLTNVNGRLYFTAHDPFKGFELWSSDGTVTGTKLFKDITPGSTGSTPRQLANVNGRLYFTVNESPNGAELWTSDGTAAGTQLLGDINGTLSSSPTALTNLNGRLYFVATTVANGDELWTSDGTSTGTTLVNDILPGTGGSRIAGLIAAGNTLYFPAFNGSSTSLWASDGTSAGTRLVHNVIPYTDNFGFSHTVANVGGILYFAGSLTGQTRELWRSDGTSAGTTMIDIEATSAAEPITLTANRNRLFFNAFQIETSFEPYTLLEDDPLPAITSLTATSSNGVYVTGQTVTLQLTFSEPVTLSGGNLLVNLSTGGTAVVTPFSGTTAIAAYVIAAGQSSPDLNAVTVTLAAGATVKDATNQDLIRALPEPNLAAVADIIINPLAPTTVSNVVINLGAAQRSRVMTVQVNFSTPVNAAMLHAPGGIVLRRNDGVTVRTGFDLPARVQLNPTEGMVTSVALSFTNVTGGLNSAAVDAGSLSDGRWRLSIPSFSYISGEFFRLFGDVNGDGTVAGDDLTAFGNAFNSGNTTFDADGNGTIDGTDLAAFGNRFGLSI